MTGLILAFSGIAGGFFLAQGPSDMFAFCLGGFLAGGCSVGCMMAIDD